MQRVTWIGLVFLLLLGAGARAEFLLSPGAQAATAPATQPMAAAAASPGPAEAEKPHLGERVNEMIDDLAATGDRLLELPLFMLLIGLGIPALGVGVIIGRLGRRRPRLVRGLVIAEGSLVLLLIAIIADRRIVRLQDELRELRARGNATALTTASPPTMASPWPAAMAVTPAPAATAAAPVPSVAAVTPVRKAVALPDMEAARKALEGVYPGVTLKAQAAGSPVMLVQLQASAPLVKAYIAIVDLTVPGLQVKIGADLKQKTLTSTFAKANGCLVAINGEAGSSPFLGAPLGTWRGHLVREGEVLLKEEAGNLRPFLSFDRAAHPRFISAAAADRAVPADGFNVLWGRWDVLVDSKVQAGDYTRQPRTGMAIDKEGSHLFLFVGDGRQPRNSVGFTRAEVGNILRALGASDGMLCDEGGSSCMYLATTGGIINTPSDNMGRERPVYTHFGITVK